MASPLFVVDAFTDVPFSGNPAAVCLLPRWPDDRWLQAVAREMNLSETAFLVEAGQGYDLRWFTPAVEVDLCGHATLASAYVLMENGPTSIAFSTRSGVLLAHRAGNEIVLDFPRTPEHEAAPPAQLLEALKVAPTYVGKSKFDYLIEVGSEETLRGLRPDFAMLARASDRGVIVTSRSSRPQFDFVSRFFAPACGIDEDPVTGSAHCCLGDYWSRRLGKDEFLAYQASARGGVVRVQLAGEQVHLGGTAVTVTRGQLVPNLP